MTYDDPAAREAVIADRERSISLAKNIDACHPADDRGEVTLMARHFLAAEKRAEERGDIAGALQDSAYLAGLKAGWGCGINNDEAAYQAIVASRAGYLAPIAEARKARAALAQETP